MEINRNHRASMKTHENQYIPEEKSIQFSEFQRTILKSNVLNWKSIENSDFLRKAQNEFYFQGTINKKNNVFQCKITKKTINCNEKTLKFSEWQGKVLEISGFGMKINRKPWFSMKKQSKSRMLNGKFLEANEFQRQLIEINGSQAKIIRASWLSVKYKQKSRSFHGKLHKNDWSPMTNH